jgi:hypothetical protein
MIVKDLYMDCFQYEEFSLAYYIHHLLAEQKISLADNISKLDLNQANHQKVAEMIQGNPLGFLKVEGAILTADTLLAFHPKQNMTVKPLVEEMF